MPASYSFEDGLLCLRFTGDTALPEVGATLDGALEDPACPPRLGVLSDLSDSTSIATRTTNDIHVAVGMFARHRERLRRIAVVTTPGARYAMMRMAGAFAEAADMETSVFTEEDAAKRWLQSAEEDLGGRIDP